MNLTIFREKTATDSRFVPIKSGNRCAASVGTNRGRQLHLTLDPNQCDDQAIYHEVFHVLGMLHEHQRPDRDKHVTVHFKNIPFSLDPQFRVLNKVKTLDLPYDVKSIMHYKTTQGSPWNETTITLNVSMYTLKNTVSSGTVWHDFKRKYDLVIYRGGGTGLF